jgi:hypothetical protein
MQCGEGADFPAVLLIRSVGDAWAESVEKIPTSAACDWSTNFSLCFT